MPSAVEAGAAHFAARGEKWLAAWEIASVVSSFLIVEWIVLPFAGNNILVAAVPIGLAFALMVLSHRARGESAREIGWRLDNFGQAARLLVLPMLIASIVLVGVGLMMQSLRLGKQQILEWVVWLPLWGVIQQYVLQGFINRRAQLIYGKGLKSVLLVALLFGVLHLPNPWLSLATLVGGVVWAKVYQRVPNLPALALSHALMSMLLAASLPATALKGLRVGIKFFG